METRETAYGTLTIGSETELFKKAAELINRSAQGGHRSRIGISGGNSPKVFYRWLVENNALTEDVIENALWSASDERFVPRNDPESNFGNCDKLLLDPLNIPEERRLNWPTQVDPHSAPIVFNRKWNERFGADRGFSICFLGMGEDGHTASIFPRSPILGTPIHENFTCVQVPEKGWRLTITPLGLTHCKQIVVMIHGKSKAKRLKAVLEGDGSIEDMPIKLLKEHADKTIWLVDTEAASLLEA
jgi:6-phosphogluconolactonase